MRRLPILAADSVRRLCQKFADYSNDPRLQCGRGRAWPRGLPMSAVGPRLPRSDRIEMGPLTEEHRRRIRAPRRWSARPSLVESRCGAVSVGRTYLFPPLSSGGALVVRPWLRFHIPLIEPDMQISRIRLSDKTSRLCFRVQRHLQFLNPSWSLYVAQSPRFFTTYCVCLELRPLPSTGITRFQRYYEPLRHPKAPGLSLAGFQLVIALTTPWGFSCCVRFPCVHAVATTPPQRLAVPTSLIHPA